MRRLKHDAGFPRPAFILILLMAVLFGAPDAGRGSVSGEVRRGNKAYGHEQYEEALKAYRDAQLEEPDLPALHFNIGDVHYRQENWSEALREFELSQAGADSSLSAQAYYNIGNTHFRQGNLPGAVEAYQSALRLNPTDMDAKYNLELVLQLLQEQPQQQQQQEKDQSQKQKQQEDQQQEQQQEQQQQPDEQKQEEQERQPQDQEQQSQEEKEAPQPQPGEMTPQQAARLLNAIREQEEKAQEERRAAQVREGRRGEYDW
jgi:tetratricopeptide (TPR) repeat protein